MAFIVRPGKYLIEKSRRRIIGVIVKVGTGGSVPKPAQQALDAFVRSLADGHRGAEARTIVDGEREAVRAGMKKMQGAWAILSDAGLRWAFPGARASEMQTIRNALRSSGWNPPAEQLGLLVGTK